MNRRQPQQPPMVLLVQIAQRDRVGEQLVKRISAGAAHVAIVRSPMSEFFGQPALQAMLPQRRKDLPASTGSH